MPECAIELHVNKLNRADQQKSVTVHDALKYIRNLLVLNIDLLSIWKLERCPMHVRCTVVAELLCLLTLSPVAHAAANLVQNGDFEQTTLASSGQVTSSNLTGWTTSSYTMLYFPQATVLNLGFPVPNPSGTTADTTGATNSGGGNVKLWGPSDGSINGLAESPTGGDFLAADGASGVGPISQTVNGLAVGAIYNLTFSWAAAQQYGFTGATTEAWAVTLGSDTVTTNVVGNASHGFVPWMQASFYFKASSSSEMLSFLAAGTPSGTPPFSLLDGVSLVAAPEPASWSLMLVAVAAVITWSCERRKSHA